MIKRGNIYYLQLPTQNYNGEHSCESGYRPCVVVSSDVGNRTSGVILVCPITTKIKLKSCNIDIKWSNTCNMKSQVLCNQVTSVPAKMLVDLRGQVSDTELRRISLGIVRCLGIKYELTEDDLYLYFKKEEVK